MADTSIFTDVANYYKEARTIFSLPALTGRTVVTAAAPAITKPASSVPQVPSSPQVVPTTVMPNGALSTQVTPTSTGSTVPWGMIAGLGAVALGVWFLLRRRR